MAFHGGFVVGVFYDCVDWSFLLARVPALLGVQGEVWRSIQCVCSVEGLGGQTQQDRVCADGPGCRGRKRVASHAEQEQGVV